MYFRSSLRVGDILEGFCGGWFGRDSHGNKRVEAIGADWVVAREVDSGKVDSGKVVFGNGKPEDLIDYILPVLS